MVYPKKKYITTSNTNNSGVEDENEMIVDTDSDLIPTRTTAATTTTTTPVVVTPVSQCQQNDEHYSEYDRTDTNRVTEQDLVSGIRHEPSWSAPCHAHNDKDFRFTTSHGQHRHRHQQHSSCMEEEIGYETDSPINDDSYNIIEAAIIAENVGLNKALDVLCEPRSTVSDHDIANLSLLFGEQKPARRHNNGN